MTHVLVKCLRLAMIPCAIAAFAASSAAAPIAMYFQFEHSPSSQVVNSMESEVGRILASSGLDLEWHPLDGETPAKDFGAVAIVHILGVCAVPFLPPVLDRKEIRIGGEALASTHSVDDHITPFTDIQCSRVGRYISPLLAAASPTAREEALGRAMGRVLAHELYHVFTGNERHADGGIARSFQKREELTADEFDFEPAQNEELRAFKAKLEPLPGLSRDFTRGSSPDDSVSAAGR